MGDYIKYREGDGVNYSTIIAKCTDIQVMWKVKSIKRNTNLGQFYTPTEADKFCKTVISSTKKYEDSIVVQMKNYTIHAINISPDSPDFGNEKNYTMEFQNPTKASEQEIKMYNAIQFMKYLKYFENIQEEDDEWTAPHNKDELDERDANTVQFMNSLKLGDYLVYYWDYKPIDYSIGSRTVPHLIRLTRTGRTFVEHNPIGTRTYPTFHYRELSDCFCEGDPDKEFTGWDAYVDKVVCVTRDKYEAWRVYDELLPKFLKIRQQMLTQNKFDL